MPPSVERSRSRGSALKSLRASSAYKAKSLKRIGLMGFGSRPANVLLFLSALEQLPSPSRVMLACGRQYWGGE
jgi:hypothetical protein